MNTTYFVAAVLTVFLVVTLVATFHPTSASNPRSPSSQSPTSPPPHIGRISPWDGLRPIVPPAPWHGECRWVEARIPSSLASARYPMCIRRENDLVSNEIASSGRWSDCDACVTVMRRAMTNISIAQRERAVVVDMGANIGACSLLLLHAMAPGMRVVAIEPLPASLYYLTRSILGLADPALRDNITVFPVACGASYSRAPIYTEPNNAGNSVIGARTGTGTTAATAHVDIVPCDDVLWPEPMTQPPPVIAFMKLDAQGYEVEALKGLQRLLDARAIRSIKAEFARQWLLDHDTSPAHYCKQLIRHGFWLTRDDNHGSGVDIHTPADCDKLDQVNMAELTGYLV